MKLDDFTLTVVFLFFPGLVCALVASRLTTHQERKPTEFVIPSLIYGILIYVIYSWAATIFDAELSLPHINILSVESRLLVAESPIVLTVATGIGIVLAFIAGAGINHKILHRFARSILVTNKFGDKDVWTYVMNSNETDWLVIRAPDQNIFYLGRIAVYSDEEDTRELVLSDTKVYDNITGEEKYHAGNMYFSFKKDEIVIELPPRSKNDGEE